MNISHWVFGSGGGAWNLKFALERLRMASGLEELLPVLADPQTPGGLALAVEPEMAGSLAPILKNTARPEQPLSASRAAWNGQVSEPRPAGLW